ncbi:DUF4232 domain-containing protein [Actinospica sp.]|uniref:DUF4232 domain-containing protein n=1 Tax=Actinospica sp. TaxID=1872142 RepID=UPI002CEF66A9|nr:DUF4232 domain-containing protein [Actinospica sp.]HWG23962.1 DUF4232 domain-containing protein [Actinospica sp.]
MKYSKLGVGTASVLGAMVAAAALSGCTSSAQSAASGGATTSGAATAIATGTTGGATNSSTGAVSTTAGASNSAGTGAAAGTPACGETELKVTTVSSGAALGHAGWVVVITNTGSVPCSVEGYPGAGVTDTPGQVVLNATRTQRGYMGGQYPSPATIVLKPGSAASTVLEWLDAPPNGETPVGANCPGMDSGKVLITPPNTRQSTPFPAPGNLCSGFEVHPLVPGTSGRAG